MENFATLVEYKDGTFQWLPRYYGNYIGEPKAYPHGVKAFVAFTHKDRVTDWRRWRYGATLQERVFVEELD